MYGAPLTGGHDPDGEAGREGRLIIKRRCVATNAARWHFRFSDEILFILYLTRT